MVRVWTAFIGLSITPYFSTLGGIWSKADSQVRFQPNLAEELTVRLRPHCGHCRGIHITHDQAVRKLRPPQDLALRFARALVAVAILNGAIACSEPASTVPDETGHFRAITRAAFADNKLWLLEDDGTLVSVSSEQRSATPTDAGGKILDICKSQRRLAVLVEDGGTWTLKQMSNGGWTELGSTPSGDERLIAIDCETDEMGAALLTENRLIEMTGDEVRSIALSESIAPPLVTAAILGSGDAIWLGLNNGEWGGGLRRISRADGQVETIELNRSGELCGGPLNTECDPVNGLAFSPWKPNCVIAAVGMVHMTAHGRIVEVCGKTVQRLYFKPLDPQPPHNTLDDGEPASTIAFFGLARLPSGVIAIGLDGIYRFDKAAAPQFGSLPKFQDIEGYRVSFAIPGVALVLTEVNARGSMSGSVPLMALR